MWATVGDRVLYFTSTNGQKWVGANPVFEALPGTWEDDSGKDSIGGYRTGISDPKVMQNPVGSTYRYTMYYTAGHAPNCTSIPIQIEGCQNLNPQSGGMGVAFSNDGITWTRWSWNPLRRYPGGNTFAGNVVEINGKRYLYFLGGGNQAAGEGPTLRTLEIIGEGWSYGVERVLTSLGGNTMPLFFDAQAGSCWMAENVDLVGLSPSAINIYNESDCFNKRGTLLAKIDKSMTGFSMNFGAVAVNRSGNGQRILAPSVQLIFATGPGWASWQMASVALDASPEVSDYKIVKVEANNVLSGWSAQNLYDGNKGTVYSSNRFEDSRNTNGALVAAWMKSTLPVGSLKLYARTIGTNAVGFPKSYNVYTSDSVHAEWKLVGTYTNQPVAGIATIGLPAGTKTDGILIIPTEIGKDDLGLYFLQLAEIELSP